jgi:hypothetical protein
MMPTKKVKETSTEQAARFKAEVEKLVAAGELNPTEADEAFERAMSGVATLRQAWFDGEAD